MLLTLIVAGCIAVSGVAVVLLWLNDLNNRRGTKRCDSLSHRKEFDHQFNTLQDNRRLMMRPFIQKNRGGKG